MDEPGQLKANTDQQLVAEPDYSHLKIAPPVMVWLATAIEAVVNAVLWLIDAALGGF